MATEHVTTGEIHDSHDSRETHETRANLRASVAARHDLGSDYEPEVIDGFIERLDARIAGRVDQELAARSAPPVRTPVKGDSAATWVALASLVFGVPITAIATENAGIIGAMVAWAGIGTINLAHAIGRWGRPS